MKLNAQQLFNEGYIPVGYIPSDVFNGLPLDDQQAIVIGYFESKEGCFDIKILETPKFIVFFVK